MKAQRWRRQSRDGSCISRIGRVRSTALLQRAPHAAAPRSINALTGSTAWFTHSYPFYTACRPAKKTTSTCISGQLGGQFNERCAYLETFRVSEIKHQTCKIIAVTTSAIFILGPGHPQPNGPLARKDLPGLPYSWVFAKVKAEN